jgi:hypothetical protein
MGVNHKRIGSGLKFMHTMTREQFQRCCAIVARFLKITRQENLALLASRAEQVSDDARSDTEQKADTHPAKQDILSRAFPDKNRDRDKHGRSDHRDGHTFQKHSRE